MEILSQTFEQLDRVTAYRLWELRSSVFVVEQECVYLDLDGRDVEPGTRHVYAVDAGRPATSPTGPGGSAGCAWRDHTGRPGWRRG